MGLAFKKQFLASTLAALAIAACGPTSAPVVAPPQPMAAEEPEEPEGPGVDAPIRVAALLPLSGPQARLGEAMANALQMAFFEAADPRLELRMLDTRGGQATEESLETLLSETLSYEPTVIVGPLFSSNTKRVAQAALSRNIPVISYSNDVEAAFAGAIILGLQPEQEVVRILNYAVGDGGLKHYALLTPDDLYGQRVRTASQATANSLNQEIGKEINAIMAQRAEEEAAKALIEDDPMAFDMPLPMPEPDYDALPEPMAEMDSDEVPEEEEPEPLPELVTFVENEAYPRDIRELDLPVKLISQFDARSRAVTAEKAYLEGLPEPLAQEYLDYIENVETFSDPAYEAILISEGGQMLRALAPLLPVYGVNSENIQLLGTGLWYDPGLSREPVLHNGWFPALPTEDFEIFARRYAAQYGRVPPQLAAFAYDSMSIVALAARDSLNKPDVFDPSRIFASQGFRGATGLFRILPSGVNERALAVLKVTDTGIETLEDAPVRFPAPEVEEEEPDDEITSR